MFYFFLLRVIPLPIHRILRISPANGAPVVCMGTVPVWMLVVVAALTVLVFGAAFTCRVPMLLISPGLYPSTVTVGNMLNVKQIFYMLNMDLIQI